MKTSLPYLNNVNTIPYSWNQFDQDTNFLALQIAKSFKPDLIVGLARGGVIPAIYLSHLLDARVEFFNVDDSEISLLNLTKEYTNILFIDEIVDSGATLHILKTKIENIKHPKENWRFGCLIYDQSSPIAPHFYVRTTNSIEKKYWIVFPWEKPDPSL